MIVTVLTGHTSPETGFVVDDYPYGFRLRCRIRYWIETKPRQGQRVVSQTTNPKRGNVWNTPKASTYTALRVLYLDEQGHVQNEGLGVYADTAKIDAFVADFGEALTSAHDQAVLRALRTVAARQDALRAARTATEASS